MSKELMVTTSGEELKEFLATLIASKKLPGHIKSVEDAFTIEQMGRELGFPTMQAFHYIIPIQGKLSLSTKAIGAVLRKGGVRFVTLEDAVYVYKDGTTSPYIREDEKPLDRRTTIKFFRDGLEETVEYTWVDATKQGLVGKDNWTRLPKEMLYARCLTKGANRIGQDLLLGLYSTDEMFDALPQDQATVLRDEDGQITEIQEVEVVK